MKVGGERWEGEREEARLGESAPAFYLFPSSTARLLFFAPALVELAAEAPLLASASKKLSSALLGIVFTA